MSVIDKLLDVMHLGDDGYDDYDDYDDDDYDDDYEDEKPEKKGLFGKRKKDDYDEEDDFDDDYPDSKSSRSKITPIKQQRKPGNGMEVCVIKPVSFEDCREITDTLLSNRAVVLNFEGMDVDVSQRIIDFISGSCYAISGNLQKISHYIFIVTPKSVDISGDFQDLLNGTLEMPSVYSGFKL